MKTMHVKQNVIRCKYWLMRAVSHVNNYTTNGSTKLLIRLSRSQGVHLIKLANLSCWWRSSGAWVCSPKSVSAGPPMSKPQVTKNGDSLISCLRAGGSGSLESRNDPWASDAGVKGLVWTEFRQWQTSALVPCFPEAELVEASLWEQRSRWAWPRHLCAQVAFHCRVPGEAAGTLSRFSELLSLALHIGLLLAGVMLLFPLWCFLPTALKADLLLFCHGQSLPH